MTLPVVFTVAARADTLDAIDWYEARQGGMGKSFAGELDDITTRIGTNPLLFPVVRRGVRRAVLRRFPYGVFFRVLPDRVQVIACLHTSRDPRRWEAR